MIFVLNIVSGLLYSIEMLKNEINHVFTIGEIKIKKTRNIDTIEIREVIKASTTILTSLQSLLPQLTDNFNSIDESYLKDIVDSNVTRLFVAIDRSLDDHIVGSFTLVIFQIPTGRIIRIEDVILDEKWRGEGIGKKMMHHAINFAKNASVTKMELTSHSARIEANKLYRSMGFKRIETNVYRYDI
jgi:ribosomal protein S18 acetylase RimI-like enzyme